MTKVAPEAEGEVLFKKPIQFKYEPPLKAWDATYLRRRAEVGEKMFKCTSGRSFCYFTDGPDPAKEGVAVVLCLHGASDRKTSWLFKEKSTDIFQICPDRMGAGKSSSCPETGYSFADGCKELTELVDAVYAEFKIPKEKKFFVTGHSMGGTWALSMAACPDVRDRIEAIAPISAPCDVWNPRMSAEDRKRLKQPPPGFIMNAEKKGCCGGCNRWILKSVFSKLFLRKDPDKTGVDWGFAAYWSQTQHGGKEIMGDGEKGHHAMEKDPYFMTAHCDGFKSFKTSGDVCVEMMRCYASPWSYDMSEVKCPCFLYNGKHEEVGEEYAKATQRMIGESNKEVHLIMWDGHGHLSMCLEYRKIIEALVQKTKNETPVWEASK